MTAPDRAPGMPAVVASWQRAADLRSARAHVRRLRRAGSSYRAIAAAAAVTPATVSDLARGRRRPHPATTAALLAVTSDVLPRARVDAGGTRLRLRALHVMGHTPARIARASGASTTTIRALTTGHARTISPALRDAITAVYDSWWDKRAPERTRAERAAAADARRRAAAGNWCPGAALDDDRLDIPGYRPKAGYKPAAGTSTAPQIRPPARNRTRR